MARREDVNNLLTNMQKATANNQKPRKSSTYTNDGPNYENADSLRRVMDLTPYKQASAWPGRTYLLVGNSYNVEVRFADSRNYDVKRRASIAMMFESKTHNRNRGCVALGDALRNQGFVEVLSRFEFDWLRRMPGETLIGPAYDRYGNLIPQAFAVWRVEGVRTQCENDENRKEHREYSEKRGNNKKGSARSSNTGTKEKGKSRNSSKVLAGSGKR